MFCRSPFLLGKDSRVQGIQIHSNTHNELAKKVCPRLRDLTTVPAGCVNPPAGTVVRSRNLGQTVLANSVHTESMGSGDSKNVIFNQIL